MCNKTIEEYWQKVKKDFKFGEQYIDIETNQYIVICPFVPEVVMRLNYAMRQNGSHFKFSHCLCYSFCAFEMWYKTLYKDGRVKAFFIRKDINLDISYHNQPLTAEFTGWVDFNDRNHLKFTHLVNNHVVSGYYGDGDKFACEECAFSDKIDDTCKNEVEEVNHILESVFDELFNLYDQFVDTLENNLHNFFEND
jgi:hypothetical protein